MSPHSESAYGLPMEVRFDDLPEVPEEIRGPSPPIEEEGTEEPVEEGRGV